MSETERLFSYRRGGPWMGYTRMTTGNAKFNRLENAYVSSDGDEIRAFPGWKTVVDLVTAARSEGYERAMVDIRRPVVKSFGNYFELNENVTSPDPFSSMDVFVRPRYIHGFKFVRGELVLFGEADFRKEFIRTSGGVECRITGWTKDGSNRFELTLDNAPQTQANGIFNGLNSTPSAALFDVVWIDGLDTTDSQATVLNGRFHEVRSISGTTLTLETTGNAASSSVTHNGEVFKTAHNISGTYPVGLDASGNDRIQDEDCLTTWKVGGLPDTRYLAAQKPMETCRPAMLATRMRDTGDASGSTTQEGHEYTLRRRQRALPYRLNPDVAADRLLFGMPDYGCVFQAPFITPPNFDGSFIRAGDDGIDARHNDIYDRPRCLGVPKAMILDPEDQSGIATTGAGDAFGWEEGEYRIAVAYRDDATGEEGIASEVLIVDGSSFSGTRGAGSATGRISLYIKHPGYVMSESLADSIVLYLSAKNGETLGYAGTISFDSTAGTSFRYGLPPTTGSSTEFLIFVNLSAAFADNIDFSRPPLRFAQMPMGAKAVRTVRGITLFGGQGGTHGSRRQLRRSTLTSTYLQVSTPNNYPDPDMVTSQTNQVDATILDEPFGCANPGIPPAYAGQLIFSRDLFPYPLQTIRLDRMVNMEAHWNGSVYVGPWKWYHRYKMERDFNRPGAARDGSSTTEFQDAYLTLPRGRFQSSDPGTPSIVPATNVTYLDAEQEDDIEAIGRHGNSAVLCTPDQTYTLSWGQTPSGNYPSLVSSEFGCVATNSMVEFDGGTAWISDRGPVAIIGGAIRWIGRDLERDFIGETAIYQRDSENLMRHAWSCHDADRGLVYFGMFRNRTGFVTIDDGEGGTVSWSNATDSQKAKFPCDEVLVWSYQTNSWSKWIPREGLEVLWMERGPGGDQSGERVYFLGADFRLYALDDFYNDTNKDPLLLTPSANQFTPSTSFSFTNSLSTGALARGGNDEYIEAGMAFVLYDADKKVKATGIILNPDAGAGTLTLGDATTWLTTDTLMVGVRPPMVVQTNWTNFGDVAPADLKSVYLRYDTWSMFTVPELQELPVALPQDSWVKIEGTGSDNTLIDYTADGLKYLGTTFDAQPTRQIRQVRGKKSDTEIGVKLTFHAGGQIRLMDMMIGAMAK